MSTRKPSEGQHAEVRSHVARLRLMAMRALTDETIMFMAEQVARLPPPLPDPAQAILRDDLPESPSRKAKLILRWAAVCAELDRGGWDGNQYINASKGLIGHPAYAGPAALKAAFDFVQKHARPGMRRPRTWRKGPKSLG